MTAWTCDGRTFARLPAETNSTLAINMVHPRGHLQFVQTIPLVVDLHAYYLSFADGGDCHGHPETHTILATVAGTLRIVVGPPFVPLPFLPKQFLPSSAFDPSSLLFTCHLH